MPREEVEHRRSCNTESLGRRSGPGGVCSGVTGRYFGDGIREEEDAAAAFSPPGRRRGALKFYSLAPQAARLSYAASIAIWRIMLR